MFGWSPDLLLILIAGVIAGVEIAIWAGPYLEDQGPPP